MSTTNIAGLTVGKPAAWLMALPPLAANAVCAVAYVLVATLVHLLFALPNPLLVAGTAASGVAVAGALMCGRKVLPGLWLARLVWDLWLMEGTSGSREWALASLGACALVLQTEVARVAVLALQILPSKLRRLRKSLQICGAGLLATSAGTALYLLVLSQMQEAAAVHHWGLQAAGLLLPEWAGIAILLPLTILWLQDDAWQEPRKWRVSTLLALGGALTLGITARAVWTDEQQTLARFQDSNTALAQRLNADFRSAHQSVQILQSHLRNAPRETAAQFSEVATAIQASHPHVQALSWNPLIPHEQRSQFERRLRTEYGPQAALVDRATDGSLVPSRKADFYVAVEHIAPLEKNRAALGLNIHANPARRAAIDKVLRSGEAAITPRIQLVQETGKSWGALYLSPVAPADTQASTGPKSTPVGFAVAVLRMEDIVGSAVEGLRFANFRLASGEPPPPPRGALPVCGSERTGRDASPVRRWSSCQAPYPRPLAQLQPALTTGTGTGESDHSFCRPQLCPESHTQWGLLVGRTQPHPIFCTGNRHIADVGDLGGQPDADRIHPIADHRGRAAHPPAARGRCGPANHQLTAATSVSPAALGT